MNRPLMAITVIGNDRPGIVASVTRVLYEHDCNLEDASSTILRGHFAMMLVVRLPDESAADALEQELSAVAAALELVITARPVAEAPTELPSPSHMVSVYGSDRPGIVYKVADRMARDGINITELDSRILNDTEEPLYALMLEVAVPEDHDIEAALEGLREELDVDVTVRPIDADLL